MDLFLRILTFCLLGLFPHLAAAMDFSIERFDPRPIRAPALHVTATGEIRAGDTEKLRRLFDGADKTDVRDVLFIFDSPGGSVMESLRMGDFIADIPAIVSAQVGSTGATGAICASACVYPYLAADYRYLPKGAHIGIHRFGFSETDMEMDGNTGAALGQAVSGVLSEYIREHRAEPELFEAISAIDHNDILWVPRRDLELWRVVTNDVYDEDAAYINVNGEIALRLKQVAITGESFLTFICGSKGMVGVADLHEPEAPAYGLFEVAVDGRWYPVRQWDVVDRSNGRGRIAFDMPAPIARAALAARTIGARVVAPGGNVFFGFEQTLRNGLVGEMIRGCPAALEPDRPVMVDRAGLDYPGNDLTTDGIRGISFAECKRICLEYEQCRAVSYVQSKSWCWPKSRAGQGAPRSGLISALKK